MKILGVSLGTKNGNNDTMCRVALEAAKEKGAEIEFIHLLDWDIQYCSGCVACSRGLVMGKGMICSRQDDFKAFYEKVVEADGVLFVDPIFESGAMVLSTTCIRVNSADPFSVFDSATTIFALSVPRPRLPLCVAPPT